MAKPWRGWRGDQRALPDMRQILSLPVRMPNGAEVSAGTRRPPAAAILLKCRPFSAAGARTPMNLLVFDIETVPDIAGLRRLNNLDAGLSDADVLAAAQLLRRQKTNGSDFLPLHLQRVVAISVLLRHSDRGNEQIRVWSIGTVDSDEKEIIQRFFDGVEKYTPQLISWNGGGFDLPVLHYRAMLHGVVAERYWESGDHDNTFRWNNYLNRYHERHLDLMDTLALYQNRAFAPLDDMATLMGFPGKMGMSGAKVAEAFANGEIQAIRDYCETDVMNTYLVYLRFEQMRGRLTPAQVQEEQQRLRDYAGAAASSENKAHFQQFLSRWV